MTRKMTREEWVKAIGQWRRSGQSREEWCARRDLNPRRMEFWERRIAGRGGERDGAGPAFVEVTSSGEVVSTGLLELEVGGVRLRVAAGFDEQVLVRVLAVLEARR
jgi:hypothetical protein